MHWPSSSVAGPAECAERLNKKSERGRGREREKERERERKKEREREGKRGELGKNKGGDR